MQKKIATEQFSEMRVQRWTELQDIIDRLRKYRRNGLGDDQIRRFPELYRSTCADLAQARMKALAPDLIAYLNALVGQAHQHIYYIAPVKTRQIAGFFRDFLPGIILRTLGYVLLAFFLFYGSAIFSGFYVYKNPHVIKRIVPEAVVDMMESSYSEALTEKRSVGMSGFMTSYYIQHNSTIAFYSFAAGVLAGLGTLYFVIYNGIFIGAIAGYICRLGYARNFFTFVTSHSFPELTGIVLAAAAGFYLGHVLIKSTRRKRLDELKLHLNDILGLVVVAAILLVIAAFIEGGISGTNVPLLTRIVIALTLAALFLLYFIILPLRRKLKLRSGSDD